MSNPERWRRFREIPGARYLVHEFWDAVAAYQWSKTRSCVATERARQRMNRATDALIAMGLFPPEKHERMPTLDEIDGRG